MKIFFQSFTLFIVFFFLILFIKVPTTIYINEKTVIYEPDYIIKGIPEDLKERYKGEGDFFINGATCSMSNDKCAVYGGTERFSYTYKIKNQFIILRDSPSWHLTVFINSPQASLKRINS